MPGATSRDIARAGEEVPLSRYSSIWRTPVTGETHSLLNILGQPCQSLIWLYGQSLLSSGPENGECRQRFSRLKLRLPRSGIGTPTRAIVRPPYPGLRRLTGCNIGQWPMRHRRCMGRASASPPDGLSRGQGVRGDAYGGVEEIRLFKPVDKQKRGRMAVQ
ncbi:hypothetical protein ASILVAE211_17465 [Acidisoma silvae]|uniref:Uncharacterized protein n=1 Tax=Acidisoma silvae TaxID=2802396 RepID=A0A963YUV8_9PROT|nr:hypothetical protein [Acidisoma silvae]MCB8876987.1 hypothetical protein [Acidisoma silvae]